MEIIQKTDQFTRIREIRNKVFSKEMNLSDKDIFDEDDKILEQFLINYDNHEVGSFRLREVSDFYKIERMGIVAEHRHSGVGSKTLEEIKQYSKKAGKTKVVLDAIFSVRGFYEKSGFIQTGEIYFKAGMPHINMYFDL